MLKTVMLLNIILETMIDFFQDSLSSIELHLTSRYKYKVRKYKV